MAENKRYTIDGISVKVNPDVFKSYKFLDLQSKIAKAGKTNDTNAIEYLVEFQELIFGNQWDDVFAKLQAKYGELVSIEQVFEWIGKLAAEATPKK